MIRFFEHLVQKEIDTKQKHIRFYAWMLMITFVVCAFRIVTTSIKIWKKYRLLKDVDRMLGKNKKEAEPVGI